MNSENVEAFVCDETYSSKDAYWGRDGSGMPVVNINEGTLKPGCRTEAARMTIPKSITSSTVRVMYGWMTTVFGTKPGDIIIIPPHVFHWMMQHQERYLSCSLRFGPGRSRTACISRVKKLGEPA